LFVYLRLIKTAKENKMNKILIKWSDSYSVGYPEIDNQHIKLVNLINKLYDAFSEGKVSSVIEPILNEMIEYTDYHFKNEEKLFEKYQYPEKEEHKKIHGEFIKKAYSFLASHKNGDVLFTYDLMNFLRDWLVSHIQDSDREYTNYFKGKNIIEL